MENVVISAKEAHKLSNTSNDKSLTDIYTNYIYPAIKQGKYNCKIPNQPQPLSYCTLNELKKLGYEVDKSFMGSSSYDNKCENYWQYNISW